MPSPSSPTVKPGDGLKPSGALFIVPTPIGNLDDLSPRAIEVLKSSDLLACEDTRLTGKLIALLGIKVQTISYRENNERKLAGRLSDEINAGKRIALVSAAGFPNISDPGFRLVRECRRKGLSVVPLPGPNAAITALAASGMPTDKFLYLGFLPPKKAARRKAYKKWKSFSGSIVLYESKHRIEVALEDLQEVVGAKRNICLARELTKLHETFYFGTLEDVRRQLSAGSKKGEFVLVVAPEGYELHES